MLQSSAFDPVLGVDLHLIVPPAPAPPIPTPIPLPFVGLVFDPLGLAVGAAISLATRGGPGLVLVNGLPVTNCMSAVTNALTLPHAAAPGIMFVSSGLPKLDGDAELFFGSKDVSLAGCYGVRLGDIALSCSDPVRLPTSVVLAIPKGRPVLNMAPMVPDLLAMAITGAMKGALAGLAALARRGATLLRRTREHSRFYERLSRRLGGCHPPANASRWRQQWHRGVRFVTGHPIDVVTGGMFTEALDLELPGPIPIRIERVYESAGSATQSSLGHGWNHTLDESLWFERGRAVVRLGDGREVEFGLWDLADRRMRPGDCLERLIHKLRLACVAEGRFELMFADGLVHQYAAIPGHERLRLVNILSPDRCHAVELSYDPHGRLDQLRDTTGRVTSFVHDERGRLIQLLAPHPSGEGQVVHRRYLYDDADDVVEVTDALGHSWRYEYQGHLMVRETDRVGLSFYFQYDGVGSIAKCVRTWGDGDIYDHLIDYDPRNRKTFVENSHREATIYSYNERNQVIAVTDPLGHTTHHEYDADIGEETLLIDPLGARTQRRHDERGDLVELVSADGAVTSTRYLAHQPIHERDARGGEWTWHYDTLGRLLQIVSPAGRRVHQRWDTGLLVAMVRGEGNETRFVYDAHKQLMGTTLADGSELRYVHDGRGRIVEEHSPVGGATRFHYDLEDRLVGVQSPAHVDYELRYDPEGELIEHRGDGQLLRVEYAQHRRPVMQEAAGATLRWEWDREGRLRAIVNEAGERFEVERDGAGRIIAERGFDGRRRQFTLDAAGRCVNTRLASGRTRASRYDAVGRLLESRHDDGTFMRLGYDAGGWMHSAENETARVVLEHDPDGHVIAERMNGTAVRSTYDAAADRVALHSSVGARVTIERNTLGEPARLFFGEPRPPTLPADVRLAHDAEGNVRSIRHESGLELTWSHDEAGRPITRRALMHRQGGGIDLLDRLDHTWRGDARLERIGGRELAYDERRRLVGDQMPGEAPRHRVFDAVGNVYRHPDHTERRYGPGARLEQLDGHVIVHDEDGNLIRRVTVEGEVRYHWNGHGLLTAITRPDGSRVEFEYDAFARRIGRRFVSPTGNGVRHTSFVWDGHVVVDELDGLTGHTTWHWLPNSATPIAKDHAGQRWAVVSDLLGTPTHLYDQHGRVCWQAGLDLFGQLEVEIGARGDCPWRRPGQYDDGFSDEFYHRSRYYSPLFGTYISLDPAGLEAGYHGYADVPDPLTWLDLLGLTGAYLFRYRNKKMYIGKGPENRMQTSIKERANGSAIVKEAHLPFESNRVGLMVESQVMLHYGFGTEPHALLNKIHSPGKKYYDGATPAVREKVDEYAATLINKFERKRGKTC
jgi:RHS repeat-associated protein